MLPTDNLQITLQTYEKRLDEYLATHQDYQQDLLFWRERVLAIIPPGTKIFEIGSGEGRDADYMEEKGFQVVRTEAADSFIQYQTILGNTISKFDVVKDELQESFDLIFAGRVFHHFTDKQLTSVLCKLKSHLNPNGLLAFTIKQGFGEEFSSHKLGKPRYFRYWQPEELETLLTACGYQHLMIQSLDNAQWIGVICR